MPYIEKQRRVEVDADILRATEPGDLTYIFSRYFYKEWIKNPRWATYHRFRCILKDPTTDYAFSKIYYSFSTSTRFTQTDVMVAAELALDEFAWRVVRKYEDGKKISNGEVFKELI